MLSLLNAQTWVLPVYIHPRNFCMLTTCTCSPTQLLGNRPAIKFGESYSIISYYEGIEEIR